MRQNTLGKTPQGFRTEGITPKANGIYMGIVRSNKDPQRMGRLTVWIPEFGPDKPSYWVTVSYASPFAGATDVHANNADGKSETDSQKSYGWWAVPPDKDNQVLVCFLNGDTANGYWFSCVYPQNMNHMVPAIGRSISTDTEINSQFPYGPPTVEYNKKDGAIESPTYPSGTELAAGGSAKVPPRPVFSPLTQGLLAQGLQGDPERGSASTSARREAPSRSFGYLSPRGNTIHIDDGSIPESGGEPENEFVRIRTRSGAQIVVHETSGYIYLITKGGQSWVELSDGGIDMWSAGPISIASDADVNIHAKQNINLQADAAVRTKGASQVHYSSGDFDTIAGGQYRVEGVGNMSFRGNANVTTTAVEHLGLDSGGDIRMGSCGDNIRNANSILDNSGGPSPDEAANALMVDGDVTSRVPTHEPFDHFITSAGTAETGNAVDTNGNPIVSSTDSDGRPVTGTPQPVPANIASRAKTIYRLLKAKGYNDIQIAGILGSWQQESTLNPNAVNGIGARGLAQWLGTRRTALEKAAGKNVNTYEAQISFFHTEKDTGDGGGAGEKLRAATTVSDAVTAMNYYERFGGWSRSNPTGKGSKEVGNRYQYAENHYAAIKAGKYGSGQAE